MKKIFIALIFLFFILQSYSYGSNKYSQINHYLIIGDKNYNSKNYKNALKYYNCAINSGANNTNVYDCRGRAKFKLKDFRGAIEDFSYAIDLDPNNWVPYFNRGAANDNIGKYIAALNDYKSSYNLSKNSETKKRILDIKQNFKDINFLIYNFFDITNEIGVPNFLLFAIVIFLNFVKIKNNNYSFKLWTDEQIDNNFNFHFQNISLETPPPNAKKYGLNSSRISHIEEFYKSTIVNSDSQSDNGSHIMYAIIVSFFLVRVMDVLRMMYTDIPYDSNIVFSIEILIPFIISYRAIKRGVKLCRPEPDITPKEYNNYLLYKGVYERYEEKIAYLREEKKYKNNIMQIETSARYKNPQKQKTDDNWLSLREDVLKLYGEKCAICGSITNIDIHHKIPLAKGGTNCIENLIPLCHSCHEKIHKFKMNEPLPDDINTNYGYNIKNKSLIGYQICDAIENNYRIKIKYKSGKFNDEEITERIIRPIEIKLGYECKNEMVQNSKFDNDKIFIRAFCELRNAERLFRLDRIISIIEIYND